MQFKRKSFVLGLAAVALAGVASFAQARDLTVASWGGNYQDAQRELYFKPFEKILGKPILDQAWDGGYGILQAKLKNPPADWDVVQVEVEELKQGCPDGAYEKLDWKMLGGKDSFIPAGAETDCGVGAIVWSTGIGYDGDKIKSGPKSWKDFWDVKKFPGKRALRKGPKYNLEFALMADGVEPKDVYKVLATQEGQDRAFKKLTELKSDIVWWEAGAQPLQLLASGEVAMTSVYNGRIAGIDYTDKKNFKFVFPESIYAVDSWVIMKGSPNKEDAMKFIAFMTTAKAQAELPEKHIAYGAPNKKAAALVKPEFAADLPTTPANMKDAIAIDSDFWTDNTGPLTARFNAWLAQ